MEGGEGCVGFASCGALDHATQGSGEDGGVSSKLGSSASLVIVSLDVLCSLMEGLGSGEGGSDGCTFFSFVASPVLASGDGGWMLLHFVSGLGRGEGGRE